MRGILILIFLPIVSLAQTFQPKEISRYIAQAKQVTIIRDMWGIPHIYGKTDADAVFGLMYAQCEENFQQLEENNLEMLGRLSEKLGKTELYNDLQTKLIYDTSAAKRDYSRSPLWFRKLLDACADGVNFFLYKHPEIKPAVITHFEPWFALLRTDGSIAPTQNGGLRIQDVKEMYPVNDAISFREPASLPTEELSGSNGFSIGPSRTKSKNAILYINPHVTFYFRSEVQMVSEEGLNVYGAVTWGTFFVYQGFNEHCGWMHTSSYADVADLFEEKTFKTGKSLYYQYEGMKLPAVHKNISVRYKEGQGYKETTFQSYSTIHGPVVGMRNGHFLSLKENNRSLQALLQSWLRTKSKGFNDFKRIMNMRSNNSNNTVFADAQGNIAYWHGNFMPRRDVHFDYGLPVDGSIAATNWKGIHTLDETIHVYNPQSGYIQNCNSTPFTVSGPSSPERTAYPAYMAPDGQNFRAINAARLLSTSHDLTIEEVIHEIGYNHHLAAFDTLLPGLISAFESLPAQDTLKYLTMAIQEVKDWDRNAAATSVATTLAIEWGYRMLLLASPPAHPYQQTNNVGLIHSMMENTTPIKRVALFAETLKDLEKKFGTWKVEWGTINRYQRTSEGNFSDELPSLPVGMAAALWGSLPSFVSTTLPQTIKRYGISGNSFIACVEFGKKVKARSVITGGQSFDPGSKHFTDQASRYIDGNFKEVLFYKEDVILHAEKTYHPGQ